MRNLKFYLAAVVLITIVSTVLPSCQKGDDDPIISVVSRKDRFTNTWTLESFEKNGVTQDLSGTTYTYNMFNNGTLTQTVEGDIFGFPVRTVNDGTWTFMNDDEDVKIIIGSDTVIYNLQRLASKELWLRKIEGTDTYTYYFEGL
jgi:hypothetical protein